jgi:multimeric flavodoxin WrbA
MNAIVLCGARNRDGQTARAAHALAGGLAAGGAGVRVLHLPEADIQRCRQCDSDGWGLCRREGRCVIEDSFDEILVAIREADVVAAVTPVYFGEPSESLRALFDRIRRVCIHADGKAGVARKPAIVVAVAGGGGGGASGCATELDRTLGICGFDVVDALAVRRQNLDHKLQVLSLTGRWLADIAAPTEIKTAV